ncbi:MAG: hypothetical protein H6825_14065 [Planctomycetes bacterium]|nr:hypothetical protein [Planctomycetota bacterium]
MTKRKPSDEDENQEAARVVRDATGGDDALPADLEAAWKAWIAGIQDIDERTRTLLRAAFEVGADAASHVSAAELGRRGGLRGGKARADKLDARRRSEIAAKAARSRWRQKDTP